MTALTYSLLEAADRLGFERGPSGRAGKQRVYRLVTSGQLRAVRIGRDLRVAAADLDALVRGERVAS